MPTITSEKALDLIKQIVKEEGSQTAAARRLDISVSYLSDILLGRRTISDQVAQKLGYKKVVVYVKEGA